MSTGQEPFADILASSVLVMIFFIRMSPCYSRNSPWFLILTFHVWSYSLFLFVKSIASVWLNCKSHWLWLDRVWMNLKTCYGMEIQVPFNFLVLACALCTIMTPSYAELFQNGTATSIHTQKKIKNGVNEKSMIRSGQRSTVTSVLLYYWIYYLWSSWTCC